MRYKRLAWLFAAGSVFLLGGCGKLFSVEETEGDVTIIETESTIEVQKDSDISLGLERDDGLGEYSEYEIVLKKLDADTVKTVLAGDRQVVSESSVISVVEDETAEKYVFSDGSYIVNSCGKLEYSTMEAQTRAPIGPFFEIEKKYYYFKDGPEENLSQRDLDFMQLGDAKSLVAEYLDALEIEYGNEWISWAVDAETLTEMMTSRFPEETYPGATVNGWNKYYQPGDDVYIFQIPLAVCGHVLTDAEYLLLGDMADDGSADYGYGCYARAMVGTDGLLSLEVSQIIEVKAESEKKAAIEKDYAIELAEEYILNTPALNYHAEHEGLNKISESFCYIPSVKLGESKGILYPCWEICYENAYGDEYRINVDAITGEVRGYVGRHRPDQDAYYQ